MARTPSTMVALGTACPPFDLENMNPLWPHARANRDQFNGAPGLLVMFICNHCPYVKHVAPILAEIGRRGAERGLAVVAIQPNDIDNYPDDRPEAIAQECQTRGYVFPYLHDTTQRVARSFRAACTPDFFLFDLHGNLAYRGQLDDSRPSNGIPVTGRDLGAAIESVLAGEAPPSEQRASLGCNIKWKPGNEPDYF